MCAAPGSKTFQMLEMLHGGDSDATGLVVANDADAKRCNLLAHQTKRMCSPAMLITNHEGQLYPSVRPRSPAKVARHGCLYYDRILCDVPCTGDGTLRKAPDIWRRWRPTQGNGLHALQLRITLQACRLLKVRHTHALQLQRPSSSVSHAEFASASAAARAWAACLGGRGHMHTWSPPMLALL
jgi:16S rRNA C967 or C1407 C5-methylase (RsmB/RsmF family)